MSSQTNQEQKKSGGPVHHICPNCGEKVVPGAKLEAIPALVTRRQKGFIIISLIVLVLIAVTFYGTQERENKAATEMFTAPIGEIISTQAARLGLEGADGEPQYELGIGTKKATVEVNFPKATLSNEQAALFADRVCAAIARAYVQKGYMPRMLKVEVSSGVRPERTSYGQAIYDGNLDMLGWQRSI